MPGGGCPGRRRGVILCGRVRLEYGPPYPHGGQRVCCPARVQGCPTRATGVRRATLRRASRPWFQIPPGVPSSALTPLRTSGAAQYRAYPPAARQQGHQPGKNRAFLASAPQRLSAPCAARHPSFPGRQLSIHRPAITPKQVTLARRPRDERQRRRAAPLPIWTRWLACSAAGSRPPAAGGRLSAACSP